MDQIVKALKTSQLENELMDIELEIKRCEGVINSTKVKNERYKKAMKKKLVKLINKRNNISSEVTEIIFLDVEVK